MKRIFILSQSFETKSKFYARGVARRREEAGGLTPTEFGRSVNPIQTRAADYAHHTTVSPPRIQKAICTSDPK